MTPRKAGAVVVLLPLTLVVPLLWKDLASEGAGKALLSPFALAFAAAGAVALVAGWRRFLPGYSIEPDRWGLVVGLGGVGLYLAGSAGSLSSLHWAGAGALYFGGVLYLGGRYASLVVIPAVLAALGAATSVVQDPLVGAPLGLFLVLYSGVALRTSAVADPGAACAHCEEHSGKLEAFCSYCGSVLSVPAVRLSRRKVAVVLLAALAIAVAGQVQLVTLKASPSGVSYATYSTTGAQAQPLILSLPSGWKQVTANLTTAPGVEGIYMLENSDSNASLLVTLSTYGIPLTSQGNVTQVSFAANESMARYGVQTRAPAPLEGFAYSTPISFLSGGQVTSGAISVLATEPRTVYRATGGADLMPLASGLVAGLEGPLFWSFGLSTVGTYLFQYDSYAVPSLGLVCILIFVAALRGRELREGRVVDSAFGLSEKEFSLYATLSRARPLQTGAALDTAVSAKGVAMVGDLCHELKKMERLGLMKSHVRVQGRIPRLLWSCELV